MTSANVDLVRSVIREDVDLVPRFRGDRDPDSDSGTLKAVLSPDFTCSWPGSFTTYRGPQGLQALWLDWLEPWTSYRTYVDEVVDVGDGRVLVLVRDRGRRADFDGEVENIGGSIWTVDGDKVRHITFYPDREQALREARIRQS